VIKINGETVMETDTEWYVEWTSLNGEKQVYPSESEEAARFEAAILGGRVLSSTVYRTELTEAK